MKTTNYFLGIVFALITISANAQNPIAHWDFNENEGTSTTDMIGSYVGTFVGDVTWSDDARDGSAINLDGISAYVEGELSDYVETLRIADDIAFTVFFKTNTLTEGQQHIVWLGNTSGNGWGPESEIHITIGHFNNFSAFGSTILTFYYGSGDVADPDQVHIIVADPDGLKVDTWHHIAGVISDAGSSSAFGELYLDGVLLTPLTPDETTYAQSDMAADVIDRDSWNSGILIGVGGNKTQRFFNGNIDDVKVFDQYLDKEAVNKDMIKTSSKIFHSVESALVYPNPVSGNVIYLKNYDDVKTVEIFNANGQCIKTVMPNSAALNIGELKNGIYLLRTTSHKGSYATQRFIRQ
jgi:hypothetical protein